MVEVEKRVILTNKNFLKLYSTLKKKAKLVKTFKRFTLVHIIQPDFKPSMDSLVDVRLRTTKEGCKFTVKSGSIHKSQFRDEYEISIKYEDIPNLINILTLMNYKRFVSTYIERSEFKLGGLNITLDKYFSMNANLMEVEADTSSKAEITKSNLKIDNFLKEFNLEALDSKGLGNFIKRVNEVKKMRVDFNKTSSEIWFKKWNKFIFCKV